MATPYIKPKQQRMVPMIASTKDTILQIGKGGINDNLIIQVKDALKAREIIKKKHPDIANIPVGALQQ